MQNYIWNFIFIIKNIQNKNSSLKIKLNQIENHSISKLNILYISIKKENNKNWLQIVTYSIWILKYFLIANNLRIIYDLFKVWFKIFYEKKFYNIEKYINFKFYIV